MVKTIDIFKTEYLVSARQDQNVVSSKNNTTVVECSFEVGSAFVFPLQTTVSCDDSNVLSIKVAKNTRLTIDTIAIDPLSNNMKCTEPLSLFVKTMHGNTFRCICPYLSSQHSIGQSLVTNLNFNVNGPQEIKFALISLKNIAINKNSNISRFVNVFGTVERNEIEYGDFKNPNLLCYNNGNKLESLLRNDDKPNDNDSMHIQPIEENDHNLIDSKNKKDKHKNTKMKNGNQQVNFKDQGDRDIVDKKRKLSEDTKDTTTVLEKPQEMQKMTKKQRRKLAKEKEKELQEVISKQNGYTTVSKSITQTKSLESKENKQKKISLTKERALPGGVLVRDIIHGTGATVKSGRKVSINYVGKFADTDKEFDKNSSKIHPLVFRLGTGEVIRGLDRGLEGMKVGGERVITIPPELGYGKKGSGKIPGNSTLCFEVKLLSLGTK